MSWTIVASIAAAISALFSAISAYLIWRQNATKIKIQISNKLTTENPQNIFVPEEHIAIIRADIQNLSAHNLVISDCVIKIENEEFVSLEDRMSFDFNKTFILTSPNGTSKKLTKPEHYAHFPIELHPYEFARLFIPFPNFKNTIANIITGEIEFTYNLKKKLSKEIVIHKTSVIN